MDHFKREQRATHKRLSCVFLMLGNILFITYLHLDLYGFDSPEGNLKFHYEVEAHFLEIRVPIGVPTDMHEVHYKHYKTMKKPFIMHMIAKHARL